MTSRTDASARRPVAESVPAGVMHEAISELGITHVLTVPDTHQKSLLASLMADSSLQTITLSTEDEALCVNAGLWIGGAEPLVIIQNVGLFAAMNALRGVSLDMKVPTCMLVGQYGRDVMLPVDENAGSAVRLIEPVLETMGVPYYRVDRPEDVGLLRQAFERSRRERGPVVVLIGAPTS